MNALATKRDELISAGVDRCLARAGGIARCTIARAHVILAGLAARNIDAGEIAERGEHMPERLAGLELNEDAIVSACGIETVASELHGEFDLEQFQFDLSFQVRQAIRNLI